MTRSDANRSSAATLARPQWLLLAAFLLAGCQGAESSAPTAIAGTPNLRATQAWVRGSVFVDNTFFVECLGENVRVFGEVPFQYHYIGNWSGNFHYNLQYRPATPNSPPFSLEGQSSGKLFLYKNGLPINETFHIGAGQVFTIVGNEVYVTDDGERLVLTTRVHVTVNANGDLTALIDELSATCK